MNILLIGSGGREHALAWKISQSPHCSKLYIAPGNPGTATHGENVAIAADDFNKLGTLCRDRKVELVVVGPEIPLVRGIRDYFRNDPLLRQVLMVGPDASGARLEGSKDFSKRFMIEHGIPTAKAKTFGADDIEGANAFLGAMKPPYVLKADGLAAGKGVIITSNLQEAQQEVKEMLVGKKFGDASARILIEEFLDGIEVSVFVLADGKDHVILPPAKDYKRIGDGDTGPNTGGMGAVSPVVFADNEFLKKVEERVVVPTMRGLMKEKIDYRGFLFIGLMNVGGNPYVIEYNARMGDPETQVVMPRIKSDVVELLKAAASGSLKDFRLDVHPHYALTISVVSGGYPGDYQKGKTISMPGPGRSQIFHAGTRMFEGSLVTDGGRVLSVTGMGETLTEARKNAYSQISGIRWDGLYFRSDIGLDLLRMEESRV